MTGPEQPHAELRADAGVDEIERDIARTRHELGETVSALSDKFDVLGRVQHRVQDMAHETKDAASASKIPLALAGLGAVIGLVIWRRRKQGR
jgi:hypothetical protein